MRKKTAPLMGVNINDSRQCFTDQIMRLEKTIETRSTRSLDSYIGRVVGIIRTGLGPAMLVGFATLGVPVFYANALEFDADNARHLVGIGSPHHITPSRAGVKWGYPISDVRSLEKPVPIHTRGIVSRRIRAGRKHLMATV